MLPKPSQTFKGWVRVEYRFFLKNFSRTDVGNCEKALTDCIVKRGIISDDRKIVDLRLLKFTSEKDKIEIEISEVKEKLWD